MGKQQDSGRDNFITVNGLRLHYLAWGEPGRQKVVLLHGYNNCAATWTPLAGKLARHRHVLALDQRGHGDSQWTELELYGHEYLVSDLTAFIEALDIKQTSIIGHSMGGLVALSYTAARPERVTRLVIEDIGPQMSKRAEPRQARMMAIKKDVHNSLEEAVRYLETADPLARRELLLQEAAYLTRRLPGHVFTWKQHQMFRDSAQDRSYRPVSDESEGRWQMVTRVTCPTLVIRGEASDILDEDVARAMVTAMPDAELVTVAGAGHYVHRDNPRQFEREVLGFLGLEVAGKG